ncbi:MAG: hypothetical protein IKP40_11320 [Clostridia bacterium]|nr:hypothetical protein [Clostridia bacterium]
MIQFITDNIAVIISLAAGVGLLVTEMFIPGFGIAGITGIALEVAAVVITYINNGPIPALVVLLVALSVAAIALSLSLRSAARGKLSRSKLFLQSTESADAGYTATEDLNVFLGREGKTLTPLRPSGMAEFDQVRLSVLTDGEFIPEGRPVRIIRVEGGKVTVRSAA